MATLHPAVAEALSRLWVKFLPEIEARIAVLAKASDALAAGELSLQLREEGHAAAHKLAGSLGTFGMAIGTELARNAELLLTTEVDGADAEALSGYVCGLQEIVSNRK